MGLYNFQPRFVPKILAGEKTHTIRAKRRYSDKPGSIMSLYTGLRQPGARLLMRAPSVRVEEILISPLGDDLDFAHPEVMIEGALLDPEEREQLARRDGFSSFGEMAAFWQGRLPFVGDIYHWDFSKAWDF